jgi:AraC-like DNA-binding protein
MEGKYLYFLDGLSSGAVICMSLLFALLFLYSAFHADNYPHKPLSGLFIIFTLFFAFSTVYYFSLTEWIIYLFPVSLPLVLLILPLFYFYMISLTSPFGKIGSLWYIHLIPSLVFLIVLVPFNFVPHSERISFVTGGSTSTSGVIIFTHFVYKVGVLIILNLQFAWYLVQFFREFNKYKKRIADYFSFREEIDLKWLVNIIYVFVAIFILLQLSKIIGVKYSFEIRFVFNMSLLVLLMFLGTRGLFQQPAFSHSKSQVITGEDEPIVDKEILGPDIPELADTKYKNSNLSPDRKKEMKVGIALLIEAGIYKNPDLSLEMIADELQTNTTYLSQVINEEFQQNFYQLINLHRVDQAKRLLDSPESKKFTIESLANKCGFKSKSSFNSSFKKNTGKTPSEYRKTQQSGN